MYYLVPRSALTVVVTELSDIDKQKDKNNWKLRVNVGSRQAAQLELYKQYPWSYLLSVLMTQSGASDDITDHQDTNWATNDFLT